MVDAPPRAPLDALSECCAADQSTQPAEATRAAYARLLTRAGNLAKQISALPAWAPEPVGPAFTSRASQA
ncbi:hypothetical protein ACV229_22475 [Burkholderia sp. MR1-5-21]